MKLFKKKQLIYEERFSDNSSKVLIIVKKLQELILYKEDENIYTYFGSKEKITENEDVTSLPSIIVAIFFFPFNVFPYS